jgi:MFS transporter, Spinster family, sphingosine-1-phosphate transporter
MRSRYKHWVLIVLMIILAFNFVDRVALGLMLQDIKADLHLTDTQLGFLTGIAFALFYSVMGIPIARWADKGNRVTIMSLTTLLWSAAVALCALAGNFLHLLLIRIGVAVGEAGCVPTAHSLIADYFTRAERPRAVGVYMLGQPLSTMIGFFAAGWLNELYGWRTTFLILGIPGLVLALVAQVTLKEPRRELSARTAGAAGPATPGLQEVAATLWKNVTFKHLLLCFSVMSLFGSGIGQWQPAFFIRSFGLSTGELGTWLAFIYGTGGLAGTYWGGALATRHAADNERVQLKVMAAAMCCFALISSLVYLAPSRYAAFGLLALATLGIGMTLGPMLATIQTLIPERMRAISIALIFLFANLIGMGLGPLAAGVLSDAFQPWAGEESLRYALLALCPGYFWAAWHVWMASKTVTRDLETAQYLPLKT